MFKTNKTKYIILGIILILFTITISYLIINNIKQEDLLKQEITNLSNRDLLTDNYDSKVKTTGKYAYIEKKIKNHYKKLSDNTKIINNYLSDKELIQILSATNIKNDGPTFTNSYKTLKNTREKLSETMQEITNLCNKDKIKNLIDKDKVDNNSYELYLELIYNKESLEAFTKTKDEMQTINNNLNTFLDKVEVMLNMLEKNSNNWFIEDEQLYFKTNTLVKQYNDLYNDLKKFTNEKFSENKAINIKPTNV